MVNKEKIKSDIQRAIPRLLELVEESCTNELSDNLLFLVSEIKYSPQSFNEERKIRIKENESKTPTNLDIAMDLLLEQYENLYDINLFVHKAERDRTIIDIRFYPKSSLDQDYKKIVMEKPPMLHCKISCPIYHPRGKFDVNWEHGGLKHSWKQFWYRKKLRKEILALKRDKR